MIPVTRLDGSTHDRQRRQIAWIDTHPDTMISMMNGEKLLVRKRPTSSSSAARQFRRTLAAQAAAASRRTAGRWAREARGAGSWTARRVDVAILVGAVVGIGLVLGGHGLEGGRMRSLLQGAAAVIVFGGTLGAVLVSFPLRDLQRRSTQPAAISSSTTRRPPTARSR